MNIIRPSNVPWSRDKNKHSMDFDEDYFLGRRSSEKIKHSLEIQNTDSAYKAPVKTENTSQSVSNRNDEILKKSKQRRSILFLLVIVLASILSAGITYLVLKWHTSNNTIYTSPCITKECGKGKCYVNIDGKAVCIYGSGSGSKCTNTGFRIPEIRSECQDGWLTYSKSCYKEFSERKTWCKARDFCRSMSADLVSILDNEEAEFLATNLTENVTRWIGLSDINEEGNFTWSDGSAFLYTNWGYGQPDNIKNNEHCVHMSRNYSREWIDNECYMSLGFACKMKIKHRCGPGTWLFFNDSCYSFNSNSSVSWTNARESCMNESSDLVVISTKAEWHFLLSQVTMSTFNSYWIGLNDLEIGEYTWVDNSSLTFKAWNVGEPDNNDHQCVSIFSDDGNWYDNNCNDTNGYICEKYI